MTTAKLKRLLDRSISRMKLIEIAMHELNPQVVRPRFPRDDRQVAREPMQDAGKLSHGGARWRAIACGWCLDLISRVDEGRRLRDHLESRVELPSRRSRSWRQP